MSRLTLALALSLASGAALAHDGPPSDALVAAHRACDPVMLRSHVHATPEARLADLLARGTRSERLAVARGAPGAADPVALLDPLARMMASSDPELAPAAAMALLAVVPSLDPTAREHTLSEVRDALAPALRLADDPGARDDLRAASRSLRAALEAP